MSEDQNRKNRGEQITSALSDALSTGDFTVLNDLVSQTLADTLSDAGKQIAKSINEQQGQQRHSNRYTQEQLHKIREQQREREEHIQRQKQAALQRQRQREAYQQAQRKAAMEMQQSLYSQQPLQGDVIKTPGKTPPPQPKKGKAQTTALVPVKFTEVGNVSGILQQVFGGIGLGFTGLISFLKLPGVFFGGTTLASWLISLIFPAAFFGMIRFGAVKRDRLQRAKRYIQLCGNKMYGQIETLARDTGKSIRYVTRDISKMLSLGMFPEGHLDDQKTCFMLNDSIHRQYLETRDNHLLMEKEQAAQKQQLPPPNAPSHLNSAEEAELNTMIAEGMNCTRRLRELNDQIPGEVISEKLYRLEELLKDIFNGVREHPEQMRRMHSMMDYYLPTTMKLVEAYRDFDKINSPGTEVSKAKEEIERTIDIINQAFAELLDNLFQDAVFDATTDAQVLKTMLAKGGLTGNNDFTNNIVSGGNENE